MKSGLLKYVLIAFAAIVLCAVVYVNLPVEVTRRADIMHGNQLIDNVEQYRREHHRLPDTEDWKTLGQLSFRLEELGTRPDYAKIDDENFEIVYLEGFDGPYLMWNSKDKMWTLDFPTVVR